MELASQVAQTRAAAVAQFDILQLFPSTFLRVELGSVSGELFHLDHSRGGVPQIPRKLVGTMDRRPVPNHQELRTQLPPEPFEKRDTVTAVDRLGLNPCKQLSLGSDPTQDREMIARLADPQTRRLAPRAVCPDYAGEEVKPRFIQDNQPAVVPSRLFLSSGQTSSRHRSMASSSRWIALVIGCWGVHPSCLRIRET